MADVQIDNGEFTRVANVLLEQSAKLHLNGTQYSIILTVWRFTYGFQRCEHNLSVNFIATATGISTRGIKKEIKILIDRNILLVTKESTKADSRKLKFNKDYDSWKWEEATTPKKQGNNASPGEQLFPSQGNNASPQQGNNSSPKKEILKEKFKENIYTIFEFWNSQGIITHRKLSDAMKGHINAKLENYSVDEICKAIANYSTVVSGEQYYWTHRWRIDEFLLRGLDKFIDTNKPLENFLKGDGRGTGRKHQKQTTEDKIKAIGEM